MANINKFSKILEYLKKGIYEKDDALGLSLLAAVSGESIFFLGPPGVGKSLIARRIKYVFESGRAFEYLMNRFSTPEEIFGPISINKLKNEDKYERKTDGYLPDADVVFLDEIWKASPAIQNTLLTALNEKIYRNGDIEMKLSMKILIAASNELPVEEEGLVALWDRLIISKTEDLYADPIPHEFKLKNNELKKMDSEIKKRIISVEILNYIDEYNSSLKKKGIFISDRRWKKIAHIIRTSAYMHGRDEATFADCAVIRYCIGNPELEFWYDENLEKDIEKNKKKVNIYKEYPIESTRYYRLIENNTKTSLYVKKDDFDKTKKDDYIDVFEYKNNQLLLYKTKPGMYGSIINTLRSIKTEKGIRIVEWDAYYNRAGNQTEYKVEIKNFDAISKGYKERFSSIIVDKIKHLDHTIKCKGNILLTDKTKPARDAKRKYEELLENVKKLYDV
ncbi:MAG: AAA family ATPase [Deferribacteraceae bacterium]|jgi:MoxR-like ATPase|nr:AAA family ATPase [Deferribacteraceae bacterium]